MMVFDRNFNKRNLVSCFRYNIDPNILRDMWVSARDAGRKNGYFKIDCMDESVAERHKQNPGAINFIQLFTNANCTIVKRGQGTLP